jgi:hypothetical protein
VVGGARLVFRGDEDERESTRADGKRRTPLRCGKSGQVSAAETMDEEEDDAATS